MFIALLSPPYHLLSRFVRHTHKTSFISLNKMSTTKIIENPEVPGLECFLPPPPPPPPPVIPANTEDVRTSENGSSPATGPTTIATATINSPTIQALTTPFQSIIPPAPYVMHPGMQAQPATPWWVTTDDDTSDMYCQWYDAPYEVAAIISPPGPIKVKSKHVKRKIEPTQDAEKVASAQKELSAMMKPLQCELCTAVMNSTLQAKRHYEGKPHRKKVSMFLNQCAKKKLEDGQVTSTTNNDWQNYCDICKTWFTSQIDASQHYAGRKHIRAANGGPIAKTAKKSQGKNQYNQVDSTGRFGIGVAFQTESQPTTPTITDAAVPVQIPATANVYTPPPYPTPLRCDLCGVSANRQDQLEMHKRGARHLRMLKLNGLPIPEPVTEAESTSTTTGPIDYSIYRTPSGQYYCAPCNLSLNSESTFAQHMESKKHKNQSNPKPPPNAATAAKKPRFEKK